MLNRITLPGSLFLAVDRAASAVVFAVWDIQPVPVRRYRAADHGRCRARDDEADRQPADDAELRGLPLLRAGDAAVKRGARLVILGKQGAGKGTQGRGWRGTSARSTSRPVSSSATPPPSGTAAGLQAKEYMDRGELVPDEIVVDVVEERFSNPAEVQYGFVLDGFPRTENQAEELDRILGEHPLDLVIDLDVPTEMAIERLLGPGPRGRHRGSRSAAGSSSTTRRPSRSVDLYRGVGLLVQGRRHR